MPLRTRLRRAFTRGSSDDNSLSKTSSKSSKKDKKDSESNVYQPGEKMPPLKYRRPVAPEHKEKLESFSWAKAWRRKSDPSVYSPFGSRMPSRKNSIATVGRRSIGGRRSSSKDNDTGVDSGFGGSVSGEDHRVEQVREGSDEEGDVTNVGLSGPPRKSSSIHHRHSHSMQSAASRSTATTTAANPLRRSNSTRNDQPFTQEELELALKRSHLEAPKEESDRSGDGSPGTSSPRAMPREEEEAPWHR